jgi:hypothetical protein
MEIAVGHLAFRDAVNSVEEEEKVIQVVRRNRLAWNGKQKGADSTEREQEQTRRSHPYRSHRHRTHSPQTRVRASSA